MILARNINKAYYSGGKKNKVLDQLNLTIHPGEFIGIMGTSGSGKSTLLNILSGLDSDYSGQVIFDQKDLTTFNQEDHALLRRDHMGFVFQDFHLFDSLTVFENVILPLTLKETQARPMKIHVYQLLDQLEIKSLKDRYPNELSRGQQQRVAIARALVNQPKVIFADEPTGNLDLESTLKVLEILKKINEDKQVTIVMVTHDQTVADWCQRVIHIDNGCVHPGEDRC